MTEVEVTFFFKKDNHRERFCGKIVFSNSSFFDHEYDTHLNVTTIVKPYIINSINWINHQMDMHNLRNFYISILGVSHFNSDRNEEMTNDIFDLFIIFNDETGIYTINGYETKLSNV